MSPIPLRRIAIAVVAAIWCFASLLAVYVLRSSPAPDVPQDAGHVVGASYPPAPPPTDAGYVATSNGPGAQWSWQPPGAQYNVTYPSYLPNFSPLSIIESIAANGDNLGGGGHYGRTSAWTLGIGFWVTQGGHQALGVRTWWLGDPTAEVTTKLLCRLWDFHTDTSVATGTVTVGRNQEFSCIFGTPYTMTAGRPYAASLVDIGPCCDNVGCCQGSDACSTVCTLSSTFFNGSNNTYACGAIMGIGSTSPVIASPWLIFVQNPVHGGSNWLGYESSATGDNEPTTSSSNCNAIEPIVQ